MLPLAPHIQCASCLPCSARGDGFICAVLDTSLLISTKEETRGFQKQQMQPSRYEGRHTSWDQQE